MFTSIRSFNSRIRYCVRQFSTNPSNFLSRYNTLLVTKPFLTKGLTCGILSFGADLVCQTNENYVKHKKLNFEYDLMRLFRFSIIGTIWIGPVLHVWYGFLNRIVPGIQMIPTMKRVFFDQFIFAPCFIPTVFISNLLLEQKPTQIIPKLKQDLTSTLVANWFLWIPAQCINFRYIPQAYQVLYSNSVGFIWNIYLSSVTYRVDKIIPPLIHHPTEDLLNNNEEKNK